MAEGAMANGVIELDGADGDVVDTSEAYIEDVMLTFKDTDGNEATPEFRRPERNRPVPGTEMMTDDKSYFATLNTSVFALTDDVLSDLTGSIHGAIVETQTGLRPGAAAAGQVVWATPFGGARDQNSSGDVAGATHYFGGGLIGTSWGVNDVRVGGFIGGSVGQLDVGANQGGQATNVDMQTVFGGLVASHTMGHVLYDARLLVGHITHDSTRRLLMETAAVEYSSLFFSPEVGMAGRLQLTSKHHVMPRLRLRYAGLFTEDFRERGARTNTIWDVQFEERTMHLVEGRAEVGVPFALANGGQINPRVGVEGRWLLAGSKLTGTDIRGNPFDWDAGGDEGVLTGTVGVGMSVPVADSMALVGNFDGALTTEEAWRATGYLGLTYSF